MAASEEKSESEDASEYEEGSESEEAERPVLKPRSPEHEEAEEEKRDKKADKRRSRDSHRHSKHKRSEKEHKGRSKEKHSKKDRKEDEAERRGRSAEKRRGEKPPAETRKGDHRAGKGKPQSTKGKPRGSSAGSRVKCDICHQWTTGHASGQQQHKGSNLLRLTWQAWNALAPESRLQKGACASCEKRAAAAQRRHMRWDEYEDVVVDPVIALEKEEQDRAQAAEKEAREATACLILSVAACAAAQEEEGHQFEQRQGFCANRRNPPEGVGRSMSRSGEERGYRRRRRDIGRAQDSRARAPEKKKARGRAASRSFLSPRLYIYLYMCVKKLSIYVHKDICF